MTVWDSLFSVYIRNSPDVMEAISYLTTPSIPSSASAAAYVTRLVPGTASSLTVTSGNLPPVGEGDVHVGACSFLPVTLSKRLILLRTTGTTASLCVY